MPMSMEIKSIQDEPRADEEVPVMDSLDVVEVKLEQLDDSLHYPSLPSPGAANTAVSFSGIPNTTSSQPQVCYLLTLSYGISSFIHVLLVDSIKYGGNIISSRQGSSWIGCRTSCIRETPNNGR